MLLVFQCYYREITYAIANIFKYLWYLYYPVKKRIDIFGRTQTLQRKSVIEIDTIVIVRYSFRIFGLRNSATISKKFSIDPAML